VYRLVLIRPIRKHMSVFSTRIALSLLGVITGLIAVCTFVLTSFSQLERDTQLLTDTHEILRQLHKTRSTLEQAQVGELGYLLSGKELYLRYYHRASAEFSDDLRRLRRLTAGNSRQQQLALDVQRFMQEKLRGLEDDIRIRHTQKTRETPDPIYLDGDHFLNDEIHILLASMENEQQWLLRDRAAHKQRSVWEVRLSFALTILVVIWILIHMTRYMLRELARRHQVESALRASQDQFQVFMDHSPALAFIKDDRGRMQYLNKQFADVWNIRVEDWLGKDDFSLWPTEVAEQLRHRDEAVLISGKHVEVIESVPGTNGDTRQFLSVKFPFRNMKGELLLGGMALDVTAQQQSAEERERLLALLAAVLQSVGHGIYGLDENGNCTFINPRAAELLDRSVEECLGMNVKRLMNKSDASSISGKGGHDVHAIMQVCDGGEEVRTEELLYRKDGSSFWIGYHARPLVVGGRLVGAIVTFADITDKRRADEQLAYQARHDSLTGLANRKYFLDLLQQAVRTAQQPETHLSLCICDVDRFKDINDSHGHVAGDEVLVGMGDVLRRGLRRGDVAGRLGGDEFCLLFPQTTAEQARVCIERIRERLETIAFGFSGQHPFSVTATFGVVQFIPGMTQEEFIEAADRALYQAKRSGRNRTVMITTNSL
jgi:diguanylate cyclase (GGDEF)-like protein/PAS domain S-box-containing protein